MRVNQIIIRVPLGDPWRQLCVRDCVLIHDSATTKENDRSDVTLDVLEAHNLLKSTRGWSTDEKSGTKR